MRIVFLQTPHAEGAVVAEPARDAEDAGQIPDQLRVHPWGD